LKMTRSESFVILFLVLLYKVWLTPTARLPGSNPANIVERKTWTQSEFSTWQNSVTEQEPPAQKCIYNAPAQKTAKHHVKYGWPPVSDVGAVTKPKGEIR